MLINISQINPEFRKKFQDLPRVNDEKKLKNIIKNCTNSFLPEFTAKVMDSEKTFEEYGEKLEKSGAELSKIQYDFKLKNTSSEKYWIKRIQEFDNYHKNVLEYFTLSYSLMSLDNEEQSGMFLLRLNKLKQLGEKLLESMEKVKQNPSSMDLKDKQQSRWSVEIREQLIKSNNDCLNHEKRMNIFFKEYYEKYLVNKIK